ncbi:uncharacterized protein LOC125955662 [Anopheles darlingi]|uniref:uncharacterized protein LOC125955662 n=1 Tax=Anopheles darlingi TaxID=43151 RepID=UPI0021004DC2|nr:uncharacterized protein LOC125955662 [Anopheles darlingi]
MNRLILAVGALCLLQGALGDPRPDFGVLPTIPVSATVNMSFAEVFVEVNLITNLNINATLQISNVKLQAVYNMLKKVLNQTTTLSSAFKYNELFTVNNGTTLAFTNILTPIDNMVFYIQNTSLTDVIAPLNTTTQYQGIIDELLDEFGRLALGLVQQKAELLAVKASLDSAVAANGNSTTLTATQLATYLKSAAVYKLVRATNRVRAYLPVITYSLETIYENLIEADNFIDFLQAEVDAIASGNATDYGAAYKVSSDAVELKVSTGITASLNVSVNLNTTLSAITNFTATANASTILTQLNTLAGKNTSALAATLTTEFNNTVVALRNLVASNSRAVNVTTDPNIQTLIDVLLGNNKGYGRYCYHKYNALMAGLFENGMEAGFECTDKEAERLRNLQDIITALLVQIGYDTDEVTAQITLCAALPTAQANSCVASVAGYYVDLFTATSQKIDALYSFVTKEAVASRNRLLLCFRLVNIALGGGDASLIANNVLACSRDGPAGTLE